MYVKLQNLQQTGQYNEIIELLQNNPQNTEEVWNLAEAYVHLAKYDQLEKLLEQWNNRVSTKKDQTLFHLNIAVERLKSCMVIVKECGLPLHYQLAMKELNEIESNPVFFDENQESSYQSPADLSLDTVVTYIEKVTQLIAEFE